MINIRSDCRWTLSSRLFWGATVAAAVLAFGVFGNPWLTTADAQISAIYFLLVAVAVVVLAREWIVAYRRSPSTDPRLRELPPSASPRLIWWILWVVFVYGLAATAWFSLYADWWANPRIHLDDSAYLEAATDASAAWQNALIPFNEHLVVPTRPISLIINRFTTPASRVRGMTIATLFLYAMTLGLLHQLVWREWQSGFLAGLAIVLFAMTSNHSEVITWYSAALWLCPLILLLVGLLAAQAARRRPIGGLTITTAVSAAGPFCFSIGVVIGPTVTAWLATRSHGPWKKELTRWSWLPLAGTILGTLVAFPILRQWIQTADYQEAGGRGLWRALDPAGATVATARLVGDQLLLRNLAIYPSPNNAWSGAMAFAAGLTAIVVSLRLRPQAWRLLFCLVLIGGSYLVVLCFRTWVQYPALLGWNRYQLFPQLGGTLLLIGILALFCSPDGARGRLGLRGGLMLIALAWGLAGMHYRRDPVLKTFVVSSRQTVQSPAVTGTPIRESETPSPTSR